MKNADTRQSIRTRYHGPGNYKGARISVDSYGYSTGDRRRIYVDYDHTLDCNGNHAAAAQAWLDKHNPGGRTLLAGGGAPDEIMERCNEVAMPGLCFDGDYFWTWKEKVTFYSPED